MHDVWNTQIAPICSNILPYLTRATSYSNVIHLLHSVIFFGSRFPQAIIPEIRRCTIINSETKMKPLLRFVEEIRHGIPSHYHVDLENRLAIAWGERKRKRFNIKPRSRGENLLASRENRARIIYLQAQDEDCLLFLAFILAYSPRSCVDFKTTEFVEFRDYALNNIQQKASPETEKLLKTMAIRKGFNQNLHYLNFMQKMFPEGFVKPYCVFPQLALTGNRISGAGTIWQDSGFDSGGIGWKRSAYG